MWYPRKNVCFCDLNPRKSVHFAIYIVEKVYIKAQEPYTKKIINQLKGLRISIRGYVNQDKMENIPLISKYLVTLKK